MKRWSILLVAVSIMIFGQQAMAEADFINHTIPVPAKNTEPENFVIAENGALMATIGGKSSIYQDGAWKVTD